VEEELWQKRKEVHIWFDPLWRNHYERDDYYHKLAKELGIPYEKCHFSLMSIEELERALTIIKKWWWEKFDK